MTQGCGAPAGGHVREVGGTEAVIDGRVLRGGAPLTTGYVRLLSEGGDFVAEVPLGADGRFRFYPVSGTWTVRLLAPGGTVVDRAVAATTGTATQVEIAV